MKICPKCNQEKPLSEFWKDRSQKLGVTSRCKPCRRSDNQNWWASKPDYNKRRYWDNKQSEQNRTLKRRYGIDLDGYNAMLQLQGGKCAICGQPESKDRKFDVDHCHKTKAVRGLLCTKCNRILGWVDDDINLLAASIRYLKRSKSSNRSPAPSGNTSKGVAE